MSKYRQACRNIPVSQRVDASLGIYTTKTECLRIGGCWDSMAPNPSPKCYHSELSPRGNRVYIYDAVLKRKS